MRNTQYFFKKPMKNKPILIGTSIYLESQNLTLLKYVRNDCF